MINNLQLETLFLRSLEIFGYTIKYQQNLYLLNCCEEYCSSVFYDYDNYPKFRESIIRYFCNWQNMDEPYCWIVKPKLDKNPNHFIQKFSHKDDLSYIQCFNYIDLYIEKYFPNIWAVYSDDLKGY